MADEPQQNPQDDQGVVPQMPQIPLDENGMPDFSKIDPSTLPPMPAVDQELAKRVVTLYQSVDAALKEMNLEPKERKEIEQNLMEAIAADLLVKLGEHMSEDEKEDLTAMAEDAQGGQPDLTEVAGFFKEKFTQEQLVHALASATESVLKDFTDSMAK
ncbi:MAG: hypothetical protein AAB955_02475 [Patescibacteria group bacterium]